MSNIYIYIYIYLYRLCDTHVRTGAVLWTLGPEPLHTEREREIDGYIYIYI